MDEPTGEFKSEEEAQAAEQFNQQSAGNLSPRESEKQRKEMMATEDAIARDNQAMRERDDQLAKGAPMSGEERTRQEIIAGNVRLRDKIVPQINAFMARYLPSDSQDRRDLEHTCQQITDSVSSRVPNRYDVLDWTRGAEEKMRQIVGDPKSPDARIDVRGL